MALSFIFLVALLIQTLSYPKKCTTDRNGIMPLQRLDHTNCLGEPMKGKKKEKKEKKKDKKISLISTSLGFARKSTHLNFISVLRPG